jgi:hypothetical protein
MLTKILSTDMFARVSDKKHETSVLIAEETRLHDND